MTIKSGLGPWNQGGTKWFHIAFITWLVLQKPPNWFNPAFGMTYGHRKLSDFYLPSFCPSPLKALNRSLGFTYSCSWWSSISRLTWPPWTSRCSSTGISLNTKQGPQLCSSAMKNYTNILHSASSCLYSAYFKSCRCPIVLQIDFISKWQIKWKIKMKKKDQPRNH